MWSFMDRNPEHREKLLDQGWTKKRTFSSHKPPSSSSISHLAICESSQRLYAATYTNKVVEFSLANLNEPLRFFEEQHVVRRSLILWNITPEESNDRIVILEANKHILAMLCSDSLLIWDARTGKGIDHMWMDITADRDVFILAAEYLIFRSGSDEFTFYLKMHASADGTEVTAVKNVKVAEIMDASFYARNDTDANSGFFYTEEYREGGKSMVVNVVSVNDSSKRIQIGPMAARNEDGIGCVRLTFPLLALHPKGRSEIQVYDLENEKSWKVDLGPTLARLNVALKQDVLWVNWVKTDIFNMCVNKRRLLFFIHDRENTRMSFHCVRNGRGETSSEETVVEIGALEAQMMKLNSLCMTKAKLLVCCDNEEENIDNLFCIDVWNHLD